MKTIINKTLTFIFIALLPILSANAKLPKNVTDTFPSTSIASKGIVVNAPDIAENGSVVNISIGKITVPNQTLHVKEIWLFDHYRKLPIAHFKLGPTTVAEGISSRFKLGGSSVIYAIALLSDGTMVSGSKLVKVTIGGCGGGIGGSIGAPGYVPPAYIPPSARISRNYRHTASTHAQPSHAYNNEKYSNIKTNGIVQAASQPVSTFSIDVDTGSYSNVRRFLVQQGRLPVANAVRVEEMINYFSYQYPTPDNQSTPFSVTTEVGPAPWKQGKHLLQIGLKGYQQDRSELPPANLVFLIDVSGSMRSTNKIGYIKSSLRMLSRQLDSQDRIAIVVYAGASGVVLDTTAGDDIHKITQALNKLSAGGSTNGGAGIKLAYAMAQKSFIKNGINRVILATDGDFNVGTISQKALINLIKEKRESGITLTTLGFGTGNYNEKLMEQLADHGNGNYAYIDNLSEARKVLVTELSSTLFTIAKDVKVQVEFNPQIVAEYRLIGYENRLLRNEDFKNDSIDAGDIGAGHTVTALYEITFTDSKSKSVEPLRYSVKKPVKITSNEIAYVRLRYKEPEGKTSSEIKHPIYRTDVKNNIHQMSDNYRFATAVAAFGQMLRKDNNIQAIDFEQVYNLANNALGKDNRGYRKEFLSLIDTAASL